MGLTKIKLGKYIELYSKKCDIPNLSNEDVSGVNKDKEFFEPSPQVGSDTSKYKVVPPAYFACNLMHVGRDVVLPIAYNHTDKDKIVSPAYQVFKFLDNDEIISEYIFLYLKSSERDRYFWFNTDASVRDGMSWNDFVEVEIDLPPLPIQQKYVDIYNAMLVNQQSYERGLEDLKLVCDAYIDDLRKKLSHRKLGSYISMCENKNDDLVYGIDAVRGISIEKKFIDTKANMEGVSLKPYAIVNPNEFAYVTVTSRNGEKSLLLVIIVTKFISVLLLILYLRLMIQKNYYQNIYQCYWSVVSLIVILVLIHGEVHEKHLIGKKCVMSEFLFLILKYNKISLISLKHIILAKILMKNSKHK